MSLDDKKQSRSIDGFEYSVTPLPFGIGHKALLRFMRLAAPVIAEMSTVGGGDMKNAIAAALRVIPNALTEDDVNYFAETFGKYSAYASDGKSVPLVTQNRDLHFGGRYTAFFEWLAFCVEVNFSSFFGDLTRRVSTGASAVPVQTTPSTSTQMSGSSGV